MPQSATADGRISRLCCGPNSVEESAMVTSPRTAPPDGPRSPGVSAVQSPTASRRAQSPNSGRPQRIRLEHRVARARRYNRGRSRGSNHATRRPRSGSGRRPLAPSAPWDSPRPHVSPVACSAPRPRKRAASPSTCRSPRARPSAIACAPDCLPSDDHPSSHRLHRQRQRRENSVVVRPHHDHVAHMRQRGLHVHLVQLLESPTAERQHRIGIHNSRDSGSTDRVRCPRDRARTSPTAERWVCRCVGPSMCGPLSGTRLEPRVVRQWRRQCWSMPSHRGLHRLAPTRRGVGPSTIPAVGERRTRTEGKPRIEPPMVWPVRPSIRIPLCAAAPVCCYCVPSVGGRRKMLCAWGFRDFTERGVGAGSARPPRSSGVVGSGTAPSVPARRRCRRCADRRRGYSGVLDSWDLRPCSALPRRSETAVAICRKGVVR